MVLVFLFLPAAAKAYWCSLAADADHSCGVVSFGRGERFPYIGWWLERSLRLPIRLASRSELFGCSFDGLGLLFLPAAVLFSSRSSAGNDVVIGLRNYRLWFDGVKGLTATSAVSRHFRMHIRLASRSELFGCSVDECGLLFLPAAGMRQGEHLYQFSQFAALWPSTAASSSDVGLRAFRLTIGSFVQIPTAVGRKDAYSIRLASRENCQL